MAFSNILAKEGGVTAEQLDVRAECDLDRVDDGLKVTTMRLTVRGRVPGIDEAGFVKLATAAKEKCPSPARSWATSRSNSTPRSHERSARSPGKGMLGGDRC